MRKVSINGVELTPKENIHLRIILTTYIYTASQFILSCAEEAYQSVAREARTRSFEMVQMIEEDLEIKFCQTALNEEYTANDIEEQPSIVIGGVELIHSYGMTLRLALGSYSSNIKNGLPISLPDMKEMIRVIMSTNEPMQHIKQDEKRVDIRTIDPLYVVGPIKK
jgi:hypothetical protein